MEKKINLGIVFGGRSVEHEVSILTGYQVLSAADTDKYTVHPVYIARDNVWYTGKELDDLDFFRQDHPSIDKLVRVFPCPDPTRGKIKLIPANTGRFRKPNIINLDCVLPATHGTFVEDGALQGLFEMADVPVAGSGVRGSAVGMDKLLTKAVLHSEGLPYLPYQPIRRDDWVNRAEDVIRRMEEKLPYPVFVKPVILGSSVAVSSAKNHNELTEAIDLALRFCDRAMIEQKLDNARDINCAVIDGDPPVPSVLEQPVTGSALLTFDEKYKGGKKGKGSKSMAGQQRIIPAPIDKDLAAHIQEMAVKTFQVVGASGVARIDFLVSEQNQVYVNELNNIPGSLAFYLWEQMGRSFRELIDRMVERAFEVRRRRNRTTYSFESNLLAGPRS